LKEEFLHYIWKYKLFNTIDLTIDGNKPIEIQRAGVQNFDSGPDFFNAKIKVGDTLWVGNVELHIKSSDWIKHKHDKDLAYNNVILHVVYENDIPVFNSKNQLIPTLELKPLIKKNVIDNYQELQVSKDWIPCGNQIQEIDSTIVNLWLERLVYERLERKSTEISIILSENNNDWETTFYQVLLKYFGLKINGLPFELLAKSSPLKIVEKHSSINSIEALLFGQAGLLNKNIEDNYYAELTEEYIFLKNKFNLNPLDPSIWKFLRMRPNNFPTIRISQIANLLSKTPRLFNAVINTKTYSELNKMFQIKASEYWNYHYTFGQESTYIKPKKIGWQTVNNIIINVIAPITFVYGKSVNNEELIDRSLNWLTEIDPEKNSIISNWSKLKINANNARDTQALIELKNNYCSEKKCLNCNIGNKLLNRHGI